MNVQINASFARIDHILPFLHISSTILLISAQISLLMITMLFLKRSPKTYGEFFRKVKNFMIVFFILLLVIILTGFLLSKGDDFKFSDPMIEGIINTKYAISILILCNFLYIFYKFDLAKKAFKKGEVDEMNEHIIIAAKYFIILNICLLFIAVYLGVAIGRFGW
ncbi:MAG: hypothetical protein GXZ15_05180 [Campylobacter sp.]|nr:hypothetical protein [Campylobacter sp.]